MTLTTTFKSFENEYNKPITLIFDDGEQITADNRYNDCLRNWDFARLLYNQDSRKIRELNTLFLNIALFEENYPDKHFRYLNRLKNSYIPQGYKKTIGDTIGLILDKDNTIKFDGKISQNIDKIIENPSNELNLNDLVIDSLFNAIQYGSSIIITDFVLKKNERRPVITSLTPQKIIHLDYDESLSDKHLSDIIIRVTNDIYIRFMRKKSENGSIYVEKKEYNKEEESDKLIETNREVLLNLDKTLIEKIPALMTNVVDMFNPLCRENPFYFGYMEQTEYLYNLTSQHRALINKFASKYPFLSIETDLDNPTQIGELPQKAKIEQQILGRSGHDSFITINRGDKVNSLTPPDMNLLQISWQEILKVAEERDRSGISHLINDIKEATATAVITGDQNQKSQIEIITDKQSSLWNQVFKSISTFYGETDFLNIRVGRDFSSRDGKFTDFNLLNDLFDRALVTHDEVRQILKKSRAFGYATEDFEPVDLQFNE